MSKIALICAGLAIMTTSCAYAAPVAKVLPAKKVVTSKHSLMCKLFPAKKVVKK